jgi:hypothetical protein
MWRFHRDFLRRATFRIGSCGWWEFHRPPTAARGNSFLTKKEGHAATAVFGLLPEQAQLSQRVPVPFQLSQRTSETVHFQDAVYVLHAFQAQFSPSLWWGQISDLSRLLCGGGGFLRDSSGRGFL